ncbi:alpha/beta-hydrolase [Ceratobasidium sp. AG-I]|nr:alpha/beta-hydrolase [Ceratobasidium sp. AG-I]
MARPLTPYSVLCAIIFYFLLAPLCVSSLAHPSKTLDERHGPISWFTCPDVASMQCAFFDVPRDYTHPSDNDTVSIFMRKLPANVTEENRLGSIFINPGGPGGSGAGELPLLGGLLSTIVEGRYDIIGFDPRGVNMTTPSTDCFDKEAKAIHLDYQQLLLGTPYDSRGSPRLPAGARVASEKIFAKRLLASLATARAACEKNGNDDMLRSVGTVAVAKDMVRMMKAVGDTSINFWGFSYGTILGATFAAMYPELVNRMVLDGVSNAESYFNDIFQWGRDGMTDTHKTLTEFLSSCVEAGPKRCAFATAPNGAVATTTSSLRKRLNALYARLRDDPMTVADSLAGPGVLKASDLKGMIFVALYSPYLWQDVAQHLAEVEQGNPANLYGLIYQQFYNIPHRNFTDNVFDRHMEEYGLSTAFPSIICSDSSQVKATVEEYIKYSHELLDISPTGDEWATTIGLCNNWPFRAIERYSGPWTVAKGLKKTKFPILFMSTSADPVTPLASAVKISKGFGNKSATLLVQKGPGHTTISLPSLCTIKSVQKYFLDGKVPTNGTYCTAEPGYIFPVNGTSASRRSTDALEERDRSLLDVLEKLSLHTMRHLGSA